MIFSKKDSSRSLPKEEGENGSSQQPQSGTKIFTGLYLKLLTLVIVIETIIRIVLLMDDQTADLSFSAMEWVKIFVLGAINNGLMFTAAYLPIALFMLTIWKGKTQKPSSYIHLGLLALLLLYSIFGNSVVKQYNSDANLVAIVLIAFWLVSFALRTYRPQLQSKWRKTSLTLLVALYLVVILLNAIGEYCFWDEFGVRYNFLAVDYLIYTNELIGNVLESYPCTAITIGVATVVAVIIRFGLWKEISQVDTCQEGKWQLRCLPAYAVALAAAIVLLPVNTRWQNSNNQYANELQADGPYKFLQAFTSNKLSYHDFYTTLPASQARQILSDENKIDNSAAAPASGSKKQHPNIVLVTMESMSGSSLQRFGNRSHLTPTLDTLYHHSLAFDQLFAAGNRTVRGLEALSLSLPPSPGESRIRQEGVSRYLTAGEQLRKLGYTSTFVYGGESSFDNMKAFFGGNGYEIVDRNCYKPSEITFGNIWGVCDADIYHKAMQVCTVKAGTKKPFFVHIMSVSNHRPFTFPASYRSKRHGRDEGVEYSDHALGQFMKEASQQPWFANTVFIIVADHCASSAGKVELPLDKYHIPALVYAPHLIKPQLVEKVCSQIDLLPTVCALFGLPYQTAYGRNVLTAAYQPRAYAATYERMAYLKGNLLTILSPVRKCDQFNWIPTRKEPYALRPVSPLKINKNEESETIAMYQTAEDAK